MKKYINLKGQLNYEELREPAEIIKNGGVVIFPTETVYGIGVNGLDEKAINKLYKLKKRPLNNPISLLVSNIKMVEELTKNISELEYKVMETFFPGPLTIILKKKNIIPNILTANTNTVGIRMPDNEIAIKLIEYAGVPIATTSANISGKPSGINIEDIQGDFQEEVDCFIDNRKSKLAIPSTVIKIVDKQVHILREGTISEEQISKILENS